MHILHVMDHSVPQGDGYSIRPKYLLEAQVRAGHRVTVLTSPSQGPAATDATVEGVQYRRTHYTPFEERVVAAGGKQLVFGRAIRRGIRGFLTHTRVDVLHAHTPFTVAWAALLEARRRGIPFVYEKRNLWEESARARGKASGRWPLYQLSQFLDGWVTRKADAVCTITESLRLHTQRLGVSPERLVVVGNGVDTIAFQPPAGTAQSEGIRDPGRTVFGFIGSFFSFEGLPLLVRAFALLAPRFPAARLVLVGDGEDFLPVRALVTELGLQDSVLLTGRVPHGSVLGHYSAMDVLVYPRYRSQLTELISPLKPLEPMAMGGCVIVSDVGAMRELVTDGETGLSFEAGSLDSLRACLERVLSGSVNPASLGANARAYVVANRQWQHMAARYDMAYEVARADRKAP